MKKRYWNSRKNAFKKGNNPTGMQIRLGYSSSEIHGLPDNLLLAFYKEFTYTNTSVSYQYSKYLKGKMRIIQGLMHSQFLSEEDAHAKYTQELVRLRDARKVCLVKLVGNVVSFPTGLWARVRQFLHDHLNNFDEKFVVDLRTKPIAPTSFAAVTGKALLYPYQQNALDKCLEQCQGTVEAGTGTGKTWVIQELIRTIGLPALVVVPTKSILNQTFKRFQNYFGRGKVGIYGDGKKNIKTITVGCAPSVAESSPEEWKDIQVLMTDELHHIAAPTYESICYRVVPNAFYRFGFTATAFRADGADLAIEAAGFPIIFRYPLEQGIAEGYLAKPTFFMVDVPFSSRKYAGDHPMFAYKSHILKNNFLNDLVIRQIKNFLADGQRVLVLVKEIAHGNIIQRAIPEAVFVRNKEKKGNYYSAPFVDVDKAVKDFNDKKLQCLIGTSVISEGTDILPVDVLFLLTGGVSKVAVIQNIGRGLRRCEGKTGVLIVDYIYSCHQMLGRHSFMRRNYYKEIGTVHMWRTDRDGNLTETGNIE